MSPNVFIAPLKRGILQVKGSDTAKFLNGLVTSRLLPNVIKKKQHTISDSESLNAHLIDTINPQQNWGIIHEDIYDPDKNIYVGRDGINSMFVNLKGRVETECFLFPSPFHSLGLKAESTLTPIDTVCETQADPDSTFTPLIDTVPEIHVDVGPRSSQLLAMQLNLHRLSAKVKVTHRKDLHSYYIYLDTFEFDEWLQGLQSQYFSARDPQQASECSQRMIDQAPIFSHEFGRTLVGFAVDNRIENFGIKIITSHELVEKDLSKVFSPQFLQQFLVKHGSQQQVDRRRLINGIFEIEDAPKGTSLLPFETNLDYTNGLSLDKGCYVGQELTIRTFTNGVIRKRIMPVQFYVSESPSMEQHNPEWNPNDPVVQYLKDVSAQSLTTIMVKDTFIIPEASAALAPINMESSPFGANSPAVKRRKTSSGKILTVIDNIGLMLTNLDAMEKSLTFEIEVPSLGGSKIIGVRVFKPDWWPVEE